MNIVKTLIDAMFPEKFACLSCGREVFNGEDFCRDCEKLITYNDGATCPVCGRRTANPQICIECKAQVPLYDKAVSAMVYEGAVQKLVLVYKNNGSYLKDFFARKLYEKCKNFTDADAICFIPMTKKAERNRGYNQAELLAEELSEMLSLPVLYNALQKVKDTSPQKSLTRAQRSENLKGCFRAKREEVEGKTLVVVDDVLTTGATADVVSKELRRRGAKKIYYATVASVEYKEKLI